jgi:hypothetical protein
MASLAAESAAAGFNEALSKPFEFDQMVRLMRSLLPGGRAPSAGMA